MDKSARKQHQKPAGRITKTMKEKSVLVVFGRTLPEKTQRWWRQWDIVVASKRLGSEIKEHRTAFVDLDTLIGPGSIYEASALLEELSYLKRDDGTRISKSFLYKGYELWWTHYDDFFHYFCLPYTQYKDLLSYLKDFQEVYFYRPPFRNLFIYYLQAYGSITHTLSEQSLKSPSFLPFGVFLQILITCLCIPVLAVKRSRLMVYIGDKFEKDKDYDFRMKFIYEELRKKQIPFVEFIRSLESWKIILQHAFVRRRPIIYTEGVAFTGRFLSILSGGHRRTKKKFETLYFSSSINSEVRFKFLVATHYFRTVSDDMWSIRILQYILRCIGVRTAAIDKASSRNFCTVLGCKLNRISTVGILHGVASRHYNVYDFMPGFDGEKQLSVDTYGLWSEWWKEYYVKNSKAYKPEQLHVSGLMRPLEKRNTPSTLSNELQKNDVPIKVLLVPGELSNPKEIMPYLQSLMNAKDISFFLTFRPYRDGFKNWLIENDPQIIEKIGKDKILLGDIHDVIAQCDIVVGTYSTAVLEALLSVKPLVFFSTKKWGDYFNLKNYNSEYKFFAENPRELIDCVIRNRDVSSDTLKKLQERFFGDPYINGSKWVVEQLEKFL